MAELTEAEFRQQALEKFSKAIKGKNLMDDDCMTEFFTNNIPCVQLTLRIIMDKDDLIVKSSKVQHFMRGFQETDSKDKQDAAEKKKLRAVRLDVYAVDSQGRQYDIEIQNDNSKASPQRARYNNAMLDIHALTTNEPHELLKDRESVVIFITKNDFFHEGLPIYRVERIVMETGKPFNDGTHIIYVNASIQDSSTALGRLMHDFHCERANEMFYREFFDKKGKEGANAVGVIDTIIEESEARGEAKGRAEGKAEGKAEGIAEGKAEGIAEGKAEGRTEGRVEGKAEGILEASKNIALKLIRAGVMTLDEVAEYCTLPLEYVRALHASIK